MKIHLTRGDNGKLNEIKIEVTAGFILAIGTLISPVITAIILI